nr:MAG TPA: hypothetical protein [Caudoviricetes sp.]
MRATRLGCPFVSPPYIIYYTALYCVSQHFLQTF